MYLIHLLIKRHLQIMLKKIKKNKWHMCSKSCFQTHVCCLHIYQKNNHQTIEGIMDNLKCIMFGTYSYGNSLYVFSVHLSTYDQFDQVTSSYLSSHYITVTQYQYILIISIAGNLQQTKQALIYVNLHISQHG